MDQLYDVASLDFGARLERFNQHLKNRPCATLDWNQLAKESRDSGRNLLAAKYHSHSDAMGL